MNPTKVDSLKKDLQLFSNDFSSDKPTVSELILPENHTCLENSILWSVARNHSTRSPKIGSTQKYFTD
jgi:hypothetical protein